MEREGERTVIELAIAQAVQAGAYRAAARDEAEDRELLEALSDFHHLKSVALLSLDAASRGSGRARFPGANACGQVEGRRT